MTMPAQPKDDLAILAAALHGDKEHVLKEQVKEIHNEIGERRLIAADTSLAIEGEVLEIDSERSNLQPHNPQEPDLGRKDRAVLEKEKLDLTKELRTEQRESWKDVQNLKREERDATKELLTQETRRKRLDDP
jgi:hypothetical protein